MTALHIFTLPWSFMCIALAGCAPGRLYLRLLYLRLLILFGLMSWISGLTLQAHTAQAL